MRWWGEVTYRAPGTTNSGEDAALGADVGGAFYRDLEASFAGQVVIFENTEPGYALHEETMDVGFTKTPSTGRYVPLFPVAPSAR